MDVRLDTTLVSKFPTDYNAKGERIGTVGLQQEIHDKRET
jgi:hypothetical protein